MMGGRQTGREKPEKNVIMGKTQFIVKRIKSVINKLCFLTILGD